MSKITAGCEPKEDPQEDNQIATITMNVIKTIVPVIVQATQTTIENAVKEGLKMIPTERFLRLYGLSCTGDETNETLTTTFVDKISQAEIDVFESDISVCNRQGKK